MRKIELDTTTSGIPFVVVDNFFNEYEAQLILNELKTIRPFFEGSGGSGGATKPDGTTIKFNNSLWLYYYFSNLDFSHIHRLTRQYYELEFVSELAEKCWVFKSLLMGDSLPCRDAIQLLYYEQNNNYDVHTDRAFLTFLYWTHEAPKKFSGGDVFLEDKKVKFKFNRLLIFPSITPHRVTPVRMQEEAAGYGRYCISNFLHQRTMDEN